MRKPHKAILLVVLGLLGLTVFFAIRSRSGESRQERRQRGGEEHAEQEAPRGPHGGRLLSEKSFQVEVTIYETGVPPQLRLYPYENGKPISPREVDLIVKLRRLGGVMDHVRFAPEADYLKGDHVIDEPHSFDVTVQAHWQGQAYQWTYSQYEGRVELEEDALQSAQIQVHTAGPARIKTVLELPGEITLNTNRVAHVVPRLAGVVAEVHKDLGESVQQGEVLAVLDSRELADLKSEYLSSRKRLELAQAMFEREQRLWERRITAEQEYLSSRQALAEAEIMYQAASQKLLALGLTEEDLARLVEAPNEALTRYEVRSPLTGTVIEKHLTKGEAIAADADILIIADLSTVWADVTVYAKDLAVVKPGQAVTVRSKELQLEAEGTVSYVGPLVGAQTRAAKARVDLPNPDGSWRPGLFVAVTVVQEEVEVPVAVLAEAIQTYRDWSVVFVQYGNVLEIRPLELGRSDGRWVEVVSGLNAGQRYAATNSFVLKAELGKAGATHDH